MTEHLTTLLAREAEAIDVPAVPAADILGAGRRLRRRRTTTVWGGAALAVAVIAAGSVLIGYGDSKDEPAPATPPPSQIAWAAGNTVYVGAHGHPVQMPEIVQALYYTSAGVLVRTNKDGSSDGGAPFHFHLVTADGTSTRLGVTLGDVVPSTDPTEPYLAWATMVGGKIQVVVHDVVTDQDVATVDVPGTFDWGGWEAPPVALSGDQVYVGTDDRTAVVNWRTGEATTTDVLPGNAVPEVSGGHTIVVIDRGRRHARGAVVDATTGRQLIDLGRYVQARLSPDGRLAGVVWTPRHNRGLAFLVFNKGGGSSIPAWAADWGWTSDGRVAQVKGDRLRVCSGIRVNCRVTTVPRLGAQDLVRFAGTVFES